MTPDEIIEQVRDLRERVEDLENEREAIKKLPSAVAELNGAVEILTRLVSKRFDVVEEAVDHAGSLKTAIQFAAVLIVPIVVAVVTGWFALRAGVGR